MTSSPLTVLLVEDDPDLRESFEFMLSRIGHDVIAFGTGESAYAWLENHQPDIAVLDMIIPQPSGFVLAQRVKDLFGGEVPVIMMSGNTSQAHLDFAYASGADRFLPKPFDMVKLVQMISELCPQNSAGSKPSQLSPKRISRISLRR